MDAISGIPYVRAEFDKNGALKKPVTLPAGVTDVIVVSHGWNNDEVDAEKLYTNLFTNFVSVAQPNDLANRSVAIVGVIWPSKRFDEMVAGLSENDAVGAAALNSPASAASDALLTTKLNDMAKFFTDPAQQATLKELEALLPKLQESGSARDAFVQKARSLLDASHSNADDASDTFFKDGGNDIMKRLLIAEDDFDAEITADGGSASLPLGVGAIKPSATQGNAAFFGFLSGFKSAAMNVLNLTTYFEMKARAGVVGKNGVAPLIDSFPASVQRIHLVGHSFGGRVVTSTAANSTTDKIRSMSLLQTAFSHNGFSKEKNGFFRSVVDQGRVKGPIVITHTPNDKAVGIAYPLASRLNHETAAKFGDANDKFGGLGRNGAIKMNAGEVSNAHATLLSSGAYTWEAPGRFYNLEASEFIKGHSDITGPQVANLVRRAVVG